MASNPAPAVKHVSVASDEDALGLGPHLLVNFINKSGTQGVLKQFNSAVPAKLLYYV